MQFVFFGLITGSILAIAAAGFALIRQIEGFLNIAHGQYMLVGALVGLGLMQAGLNIYLAGLGAAIIVGVVGVVIAWVVFFPLRDKGQLSQFFQFDWRRVRCLWCGPGDVDGQRHQGLPGRFRSPLRSSRR